MFHISGCKNSSSFGVNVDFNIPLEDITDLGIEHMTPFSRSGM